MASFTHVAQDVSPQYGRVTKITIRVCVTGLHRYSLYHRYAPAGRLHRHRLGRTCIRNSMDGGWINAGVYTLYRDNYKKTG